MKKHQIRIVGGTYRGTRISVPEGAHLRPTPDRIRETLFNWLAHFWGGSFASRQVLDLFAGTGALGFEAASRGAGGVQLVECAPAALAALRALQARLRAPAVRIHAGDALAFLRAATTPTYDLVLLDPPFGAGWLARTLPLLDRVLPPGGLVYLESENPPEALPAGWRLLRQGRAGQVHYGLAQFAAMQKTMNNGPADTNVHPANLPETA